MSDPVLVLEQVNAYYGRAQVLHGVSFAVGREPVAVIGRNGMGKTTLCLTVMGLMARADGSIRFQGQELMGRAPYKISGAGIGFVPQGRRLFPSLSTEEHLDMLGSRNGGRWTKRAIWELFPRLAERRKVGAAQLSGGEQQMLAIARALLSNPALIIMDEPSEGLAPTIVENLVSTCLNLVQEGVGLLLIEQNLGVATSLAQRQLVMVAGEIAAETSAEKLLSDPEAQQRYLGVTRVESASAQGSP
jgi:branched-chain amino acid transport system ATP-binding protein